MSKFKVGDKVKIIECSSESIRIKYINRIATITKLRDNGEYVIDLDNGVYFWYEFEFESYKEYPKEYSIHNLLNDFPEGTEFITSAKNKYRIYDGELSYCYDVNHSWSNSTLSLKEILNTKFMKFTKVEDLKLKPMTFEEAVKTGKRLKFTHTDYVVENFTFLNDIFQNLSEKLSSSAKDIILEGIWYAEGVYE